MCTRNNQAASFQSRNTQPGVVRPGLNEVCHRRLHSEWQPILRVKGNSTGQKFPTRAKLSVPLQHVWCMHSSNDCSQIPAAFSVYAWGGLFRLTYLTYSTNIPAWTA